MRQCPASQLSGTYLPDDFSCDAWRVDTVTQDEGIKYKDTNLTAYRPQKAVMYSNGRNLCQKRDFKQGDKIAKTQIDDLITHGLNYMLQ